MSALSSSWELALRDFSRHAGLDWSIRDELETMDACVLVGKLRAKDKRFSPDFFASSSSNSAQRYQELKAYSRVVTELELCQRDDSVAAWRRACDELCVSSSSAALSPAVLEQCRMALARSLAKEGCLAEASDVLKRVLIGNARLGAAWVERGKVFIQMRVPTLALVHFTQPAAAGGGTVGALSKQLQQEAQDMVAEQSAMTLLERRQELEQQQQKADDELFRRAELLMREERFYLSAALYYAACLASSSSSSSTPRVVVQCLLGIAACWRRTRGEDSAEACIELCNLAWQASEEEEEESVKRSIALERAKAYMLDRQYALALRDLQRLAADDKEVKQLTQRCVQLDRKPAGRAATAVGAVRVVVAVEAEEEEDKRAHRLYGGVPLSLTSSSSSTGVTMVDLRATKDTATSTAHEVRVTKRRGDDNDWFVSFPPSLDYAVLAEQEEDVLWTWADLCETLARVVSSGGSAAAGGCARDLSSLLLGTASLTCFTSATASNHVSLPHVECEYVGPPSLHRFAAEFGGGLLTGVAVRAGKRELSVTRHDDEEEEEVVVAASPITPPHHVPRTGWRMAAALATAAAVLAAALAAGWWLNKAA